MTRVGYARVSTTDQDLGYCHVNWAAVACLTGWA
ncbi:DNA invertase Pin-like site-specific DNA recombinase [Rhizobium ruizarguesonis]